MSNPLSAAEAKELIRLCEAGRLYEVEAWIRAGRSLTVPGEVRKTPLRVAISTGFHSLVELLLRHEESQKVKNDALRLALMLDRPPFIELAVTHGAEIASVPFLDVLLTGDRRRDRLSRARRRPDYRPSVRACLLPTASQDHSWIVSGLPTYEA